MTPAIEDLIMHRATAAKIKAKAVEEGFVTMRDYGWEKTLSGDTTVEEVLAATTVELVIETSKT